MKQLFEVITLNFDKYYVIAKDYNQAEEKTLQYIIINQNGSVLKSDGSLNQSYKLEVVSEIKCISNELIY